MFNIVMTLVVILSFVFSGGTVAAAQTSMPDEALYPVKTWSEEVRISMANSEQVQLRLALEFTSRRMAEIQTMLQAGKAPSEAVMTRLQAELEYALQLAAGMPEDKAQPALLQVQTRLQQQTQTMAQLHLNDDADPALLQIRERIQTMLQQQLHLCQAGAENPAWLREQLRTQTQEQLRLQYQTGVTNGAQEQYQNQNQNQNQVGEPVQNQDGALNQNQYQNQSGEQYQNQNQYQEQNTEKDQKQEQYQNQNGTGNDESITPSGSDCPECDCPEGGVCDCVCDGTGPGTGGEGDCPNGDCDGTGTGPGPGDGTCPECDCPAGDCECDGTGPGPGDGTCPECDCPEGGDCDCLCAGSGQTEPGGNGGKP